MNQLTIFYPLVVGVDNPILRKKSEPIHVFDTEMAEFADILLTLMTTYDGVGLAAPQLGKHIRMIAITARQEKKGKNGKKDTKTYLGEWVMCNPEILDHSTTKQITEEACLSVPGEFGEVERWQWITVKYQDTTGKEIVKKLKGFNAVIVQHEIDHLNGILFTDKVIKKPSALSSRS
jgi:peptide deformylase